ncbi:phage baseplate plug family protein [Acetobacter pasteurianus]
MNNGARIALNAVAAQTLKVSLPSCIVQITLRQRSTGLYADFSLNGVVTVCGVICQDRTWLIRDSYLGFRGDFIFVDTQGSSDPTYSGLGDRYLLIYVPGQNA